MRRTKQNETRTLQDLGLLPDERDRELERAARGRACSVLVTVSLLMAAACLLQGDSAWAPLLALTPLSWAVQHFSRFAADGKRLYLVLALLSGAAALALLGWYLIQGQEGGMFSIGNWRWDCEAKGYFYDSTGQPVKNWTNNGEITHASGIQAEDHASMTIKLNGTKVGNSAQTTAALGIDAKVTKDLSFGIDWNYYGRNYADWSFSTSDLVANGVKVYETPWQIPSASVFDFSARYRFNIGKIQATLYGNIDNIFNQTFITDAQDGASHTWEDAEVFYAWGRTYSLRLKIDF